MTYLATSINDSPTIIDKAGTEITDVRGKGMKFVDGALALCDTAGEVTIGVGIMTNDETIEKGGDVTVQIKDIGLVKVGAAVLWSSNFVTRMAKKFVLPA